MQDESKNIPPKDDKKCGSSFLSKLIIIICCSAIAFVGINFVNCSFMIPGSVERSYVLGGLKKPPSLNCSEAQKNGFSALVTLLTTVIALKAKFD